MKNPPVGYIQVKEAAELLGVAERTIRTWCRKRVIPHHKLGHFVFFKQDDLLSHIESCKVEPKPQEPKL